MGFKSVRGKTKEYNADKRKLDKVSKKVNTLYKAIETKFHEFTATHVTGYSAAISSLNEVPQGATDISRNGDKIFIKYVDIRMFAAIGALDTTARVIVLWDKMNTTTNGGEVLNRNASGLAPLSHNLYDFRKNYTVLYDRMFELDGVRADQMVWRKIIKVRKATQYAAGTANIESGVLKLFVWSQIPDGNPAADKLTFEFVSRIYYLDN